MANTPASCTKQAARATPKGSLRLLCAGDAENAKQPGFYVGPFYGRGGTSMPRFVDYKDIKAENGMVEMWDDVAKAPYLADSEGVLVLGYDTPQSMKIKCDYIKETGLLGAMYWEYAGDNATYDLSTTLATEMNVTAAE